MIPGKREPVILTHGDVKFNRSNDIVLPIAETTVNDPQANGDTKDNSPNHGETQVLSTVI